ncbi:MAG: hypothetical protein Q7J98_14445 [Kiritimatiellia bacterium]|nr:hypothetical protein [Kiritimatiellia bacterium]
MPEKSSNHPSSRGEVVAAMSFVNFATAVLFGVFALLTEKMAESLQVPNSQRVKS